MKRLSLYIIGIFITTSLFWFFASVAKAAPDFVGELAGLGEEQAMNTPLSKLQLNGLTAYAIIRILGQAYAAIRAGGGLKGIFNALVYGENAPKVIMQDYHQELGIKKVDTPPTPPT